MPLRQSALDTSRYAFLGISLFWLVGCGATCEYATPVTEVDRPDLVDISLISQEPCAPPCWQGITPGVSTHDEAEAILQGMEVVDQESYYPHNTPDRLQVWWGTILPEEREYVHSLSSDSSGIVEGIYITQMWVEITLDELIQIYGEPDGLVTNISGLPDVGPICRDISVLWVDHGLKVSLASIKADDTTTPLATSASLVYGAKYFQPASSLEEYREQAGPYFEESFTEWADSDYDN
jgi:hypothetical protein